MLGGRYRLLALLGTGASAQVYLADDVRLRRRVAVKVLHPALVDDGSFLRRFRAEAQAAASLSHPHLLAVFDWSDEATPFLVTEHLAGGSLRSLLDAGHRLSPAQALVVGLEAARGLDHAHRQGFVHRDIKPANLLFGADGRLRVADFGLARAVAEAGWTEPGAVLGTARYASPEQVRGEGLDGRSDVYSLALVLVEAVTGRVPFTADTTIGTLMARLSRSIDVPDDLGPLRPALAEAGRLDRDERSDAAALAHELVATAPALTRPDPLPLVGPGGLEAAGDATLLRPTSAPPPVVASPGRSHGDPSSAIGAGPTILGADGTPSVPAAGPSAPPGGRPTTAPRRRWRGRAGGGAAGGALPYGGPAAGGGPLGMSPNDRGARRLLLGAVAVLVTVVLGVAGGWLYGRSRTPTYPVPDLVGMQRVDVPGAVAGHDWDIADEHIRRDGTRPGQVMATDPAAGRELARGATLHVVVSDGATLVAVPTDLVGKEGHEAVAALEAAGLAGELVPRPSGEVEEGLVLGFADGDPGGRLPRGTTVRLAVSSGDEVEVPAVRGLAYARAADVLEGVGLEAEVEVRAGGGAEPGHVVDSDPDEGERVEAGSTVTLVVAVDEVEVPALEGRSLEEASSALADAGLAVGAVVGPRQGTVSATWPAEGSRVASATPVNLVMRRR